MDKGYWCFGILLIISEDRTYWSAIREEFLHAFETLFEDNINFAKFPKGHDPNVCINYNHLNIISMMTGLLKDLVRF